MNEILDQLIIRFLFTIFICIALIVYKYAHALLYPSSKKQLLKIFYPSENSADTLHIFARLIGIGLIFSKLEFNEYQGIDISTIHFFVWSLISIILYLLSIFIIENIVLYNFDYKDEVLKRKNLVYGVVSFSTSLSLAFIVRTILAEAEKSIIILVILWLLALVLFGFAIKLFNIFSKLAFNKLMIQKSMGLALSYSGFVLGCTIIINTAFDQEHHNIQMYIIQVLLKTILGLLVFPIFRLGVIWIYKLHNDHENLKSQDIPNLGYGIYEGSVFLMCALLTSIIIGKIHFGTIYPFL